MKQPSAKEHFEAHAESWLADHYGEDSYAYPTPQHRIRIVLDILSSRPPGLDILDIGCGGGDLALALVDRGHTVIGLDQSERMVEIAVGRGRALAEDKRSKVSFMVRGIDDIDLPPSFDVATSMGVIGYLDNDNGLIKAAFGALKPGGLFIVSCRNRLFNLSSLSYRTVREFETGAAPALLDEMAEYCQDVPVTEAKAFVERLRGLSEAPITRDPPYGGPAGAPVADENTVHSIEARQHTPRELTETAARHGLILRGVHGVNPHLIDPRLNRLLPPGVYNAASSALEAFESLPVSLLWSSVFIGVYEKPVD